MERVVKRDIGVGRAEPSETAVSADFLTAEGANLLDRWDAHQRFWDDRLAAGLDPYQRSLRGPAGVTARAQDRGGVMISGVNFASQDYLSLATHPAIRDVAVEAIARHGVHSAGSLALQGGSEPLVRLTERLAEWLRCRSAVVFPTGWAAGFGAIRALVRESDHIVLDSLAHACLQEGAAAATRNIHRVPHLSCDAIARRLARIRAEHATQGILVVTESLFSMNSTVPDLRAMQDICRSYDATLLVDVAHDLGAIADDGLGFLGDQGMIGEVDLVVGAFSKTFASNGGFVAGNAPGLRQALIAFAGPLTFSNALSPVQAAVVDAALDIVRSAEGARRRKRLMENANLLREGLAARAFDVLGQTSAIVPVTIGDTREARLMTRAALSIGGLVNLVEHPAVSRNQSRWRLQVMADHTPEHIDRMVAIAVVARETIHQPEIQGAWS
jgi:glycine C-acetyltransferase